MNDDDGEPLNPWVVIADCTIALAFILIVFASVETVEGSQALSLLQKRQRQERVRLSLFKDLQNFDWGSIIEPNVPSDRRQPLSLRGFTENDRRQTLFYGKEPIAEVFENASFQRLSIYVPQFREGDASLSSPLAPVFQSLGRTVKANWEYLGYFDLDGISMTGEHSTTGALLSEKDSISLSEARADSVLALMQSTGAVSQLSDAPTPPPGQYSQIPLKYTVPYGLGDKLYSEPTQRGRRVDLVLFFEDVGS